MQERDKLRLNSFVLTVIAFNTNNVNLCKFNTIVIIVAFFFLCLKVLEPLQFLKEFDSSSLLCRDPRQSLKDNMGELE